MSSLHQQIVQHNQAGTELQAMLRWGRPYEQSIYQVALTLLSDERDADAVLAETVLKAWDHFVRPCNQRPSLLEVLRIAVGESVSILRFRAGDLTGWLEDSDQQVGEIATTAIPWVENPESLFSQTEWKKILRIALDSLSPLDRVVFLLRDVLHFSEQQTAEIVDRPVEPLKVRLCRARLRLREWLNPLCRATGVEQEVAVQA